MDNTCIYISTVGVSDHTVTNYNQTAEQLTNRRGVYVYNQCILPALIKPNELQITGVLKG